MFRNVIQPRRNVSFFFLIFHHYYQTSFEMIKVLLSAPQRKSKNMHKLIKLNEQFHFGSSHSCLEQFKRKLLDVGEDKTFANEKICTLYHNIIMDEKQPKLIKQTKLYIFQSSQCFQMKFVAQAMQGNEQMQSSYSYFTFAIHKFLTD